MERCRCRHPERFRSHWSIWIFKGILYGPITWCLVLRENLHGPMPEAGIGLWMAVLNTIGVSETRPAQPVSAIHVRIDDAGSTLNFHVRFFLFVCTGWSVEAEFSHSFGEGIYRGSILHFRIRFLSSIGGRLLIPPPLSILRYQMQQALTIHPLLFEKKQGKPRKKQGFFSLRSP